MKHILSYREPVRKTLLNAITSTHRAQSTVDNWQQDFMKRLATFASGGKLLRGSLLCFAYEMIRREPANERVLRAAAALEILHSALLMHDDIMDNDDLRRGRPAMHIQYRDIGEQSSVRDPSQFGLNMALGGADLALFMALSLLNDLNLEPHANNQINRLFTARLVSVCTGQLQDVYYDAHENLPTKRALLSVMKNKTASYSLALPLEAGAILGGASNKTQLTLRTFGEAAGTIFQIRDDELGIMGTEKTIGKPVGSDIAADKKTLFYYYLFKKSTASERKRLRAIFGNSKLGSHDIRYIQNVAKNRGVNGYIESDIHRLESQAYDCLKLLPLQNAAKQELRLLVTFCAQRKM